MPGGWGAGVVLECAGEVGGAVRLSRENLGEEGCLLKLPKIRQFCCEENQRMILPEK